MSDPRQSVQLKVSNEMVIHQQRSEVLTVDMRDWNRIKGAVSQLDGKASPFASAGWAFFGVAAAGALQLVAFGASASSADRLWVLIATWVLTVSGAAIALVCLIAHYVTKKHRGNAADQIVTDMESLIPESLSPPA